MENHVAREILYNRLAYFMTEINAGIEISGRHFGVNPHADLPLMLTKASVEYEKSTAALDAADDQRETFNQQEAAAEKDIAWAQEELAKTKTKLATAPADEMDNLFQEADYYRFVSKRGEETLAETADARESFERSVARAKVIQQASGIKVSQIKERMEEQGLDPDLTTHPLNSVNANKADPVFLDRTQVSSLLDDAARGKNPRVPSYQSSVSLDIPEYVNLTSPVSGDHQFAKRAFYLAQTLTRLDTGHYFELDQIEALAQLQKGGDRVNVMNELVQVIEDEELSPTLRTALEQSVDKQLALFQQEARKGGYDGVEARLPSVVSVLKQADLFVPVDLYANPDDMGALEKRLWTKEFFDESEYARLEEALYHYNQGDAERDPQLKAVPITEQEAEFAQRFADRQNDPTKAMTKSAYNTIVAGRRNPPSYQEFMQTVANGSADPYAFRNALVDFDDALVSYQTRIRSDQEQVRVAMNLIRRANASGQNIASVLEHDDFQSTIFGQRLLSEMKNAGTVDDEYALRSIRYQLQGGQMNQPVYIASSLTSDPKRMMYRLEGIMQEYAEPISEDFAPYHQSRSVRKMLLGMKGDMRERASVINAEWSLYIQDGTDREFDDGKEAMYRESTRLMKIQEENERAFEAHRQALEEFMEDNKEKPRQPLNRFRGAFTQAFLTSGSAEAKTLAASSEQEILGWLREGSANLQMAKATNEELLAAKAVQESEVAKWFTSWQTLMDDPAEDAARLKAEAMMLSAQDELDRIGLLIGQQDDVLKHDGYLPAQMEGKISQPVYAFLRSFWRNPDNRNVTYLVPEEVNPKREADWTAAMKEDRLIRMPASEVGYRIEDVTGGYARLRKETVRPASVVPIVDLDVETLGDTFARIDEKEYTIRTAEDVLEEFIDPSQKDHFVTMIFDQSATSPELNEKYPALYEKLVLAHDTLQQSGVDAFGEVERNIRAVDLGGAYDHFRVDKSTLSESGIRQRKSLPKFLLQMVESHAPWMQQGNLDEMISNAEVSLRQTIRDLAANQSTINLTDSHLIADFESALPEGQSTNQALVEKFADSLKNKGLKERLDDFLFMRVLGGAIQEHFRPNEPRGETTGDYGEHIRTALIEARDIAIANGRKGLPSDVMTELKDPATQLILQQEPYYRQLSRLDLPAITQILKESDGFGSDPITQYSGMTVSLDEMVESEYADDMVGSYHATYLEEQYGAHDLGDGVDAPAYKPIFAAIESEEPIDIRPDLERDLGPPSLERQIDTYLENADLQEPILSTFADRLREGDVSFNDTTHLETILRLSAEQNGTESIRALVDGQEADLYIGSQGELLIHRLADNTKAAVTNSDTGTTMEAHVNDYRPNKLYGAADVKEDITDNGAPMRRELVPYAMLHRSGQYTVPTDPATSFQVMHRFLQGKEALTYLDIETTGLEGSTIDPKYIQPVEVYMRKIQWDKEAGEIRVNEAGESVVRTQGKESVRDAHLLMPLTNETEDFMNTLIADEDFRFQVGDANVSVFTYESNKEQMDAVINARPDADEIQQTIREKSDRAWFLRNIAKYAFTEADTDPGQTLRFQRYAGNAPIPALGEELAAFTEGLRQDAAAGADNLRRTSLKGNDRAVFSEGQIGTTLDRLPSHVTRFTGKGNIIGQNVAQADWSKFIQQADANVADASRQLDATTKGLEAEFEYLSREPLANIQSALRGELRFDREQGLDVPATEYKVLDLFTPEALKGTTFYDQLGHALDDVIPAMYEKGLPFPNRMNASLELIRNNYLDPQLQGIHQSLADINYLDNIKGEYLKGLGILHTGENTDSQVLPQLIRQYNNDRAALKKEETIRGNLDHAKAVEQQFLYEYLNPDATKRNAETQIDTYGVATDEKGLHLAKGDVLSHINVVGKMGKELASDDAFMSPAMHEPLKAGDVVELHKSLNQTTPLGLYNVEAIDTDAHQLTIGRTLPDGTNESHTIHGASQFDLNAKFRQHFSFVGAPKNKKDIAAAAARVEEDTVRRQLDRASSSLYAFEKYEVEAGQLEEGTAFSHRELQAANEAYQQFKSEAKGYEEAVFAQGKDEQFAAGMARELGMDGSAKDGVAADLDITQDAPEAPVFSPDAGTVERVMLDPKNRDYFESNRFIEALEDQPSPSRQQALAAFQEWSESKEGQTRKDMLATLERANQVGAITKQEKNGFIEQFHQAIKEEGQRRGAKHTVYQKANLGTLDDSFGSRLSGTQFVMDTSSPSRMQNDLFRLAERSGVAVDPSITDEVDRKKQALNQTVLPFLQKQGFIETFDPANPPKINNVVRQLLEQDLPAVEEFDAMKSAALSNTDSEYATFIEGKAGEILRPILEGMSATQQAKMDLFDSMTEELKEAGMYHPDLHLEPRVEDAVISSLQVQNFGGLRTVPAQELAEQFRSLDRGDLSVAETDMRNVLAGELFQRATTGRGGVEEAINRGVSDQLLSMEALNWVQRARGTDGEELLDHKGSPIFEPNADVASHYFGGSLGGGIDASKRLKEMDLETLDSIANQTSGAYTKGNGYTVLKNKIEGWRESGYQGRNKTAPAKRPARIVVPDEDLHADTKERGKTRRVQTEMNGVNQAQTVIDDRNARYEYIDQTENVRYQHTNVISDTLSNAKDSVKNMATDFVNLGGGKAAAWIGGIGLAAFALHSFANASSPIKLDRKEQGHGVEGATGQANDGIQLGNQNTTPDNAAPQTGKTAYVDAGNGQTKGYRIKVDGQADANMNTAQVNKQVSDSVGNFNMNVTDNRQSLDRSWLENTLSGFMDKGYVEQ